MSSVFAYESQQQTADRLKLGRQQLGLTQKQLGEAIDVTAMTIRRREQCLPNSMPDNAWQRAYLLEQLADLGCPRDVLGLPSTTSLQVEGPAPTDLKTAEEAIRAAELRVARAVEAMHRTAETAAQLRSEDLPPEGR
jgi:transcriptional regulator with XRE-family HTH domain